MLFMLLVLGVTGIIIYSYNRKVEAMRWILLFALSSALGPFSRLIADYMVSHPGLPMLTETILNACRYSSLFIGHTFSVYFLTVYAIVYSDLFSLENKRRLVRYLLIPIVISMVVVLLWGSISPVYHITLLIWVAPYLIGSCFLFIYSYFLEKNKTSRNNRLITALIFVPAALGTLVFMYMADVWAHSFNLYRFMPFVIGYAFTMFLVSSVINGALGVRIRIDNHMLNQTMRAMTSGTSIINHTIKNEITKINYLTDKVKSTKDDEQKEEAIEAIFQATDHMLNMVKSIRQKTEDFELQNEPIDLIILLESALSMVIPLPKELSITITKSYNYENYLICDPLHVKEVFINVMQNAIESINERHPRGGILRIVTKANRSSIYVTFEDNGKGISKKNLSRVKEPFFTTKNKLTSHGLGLSYCFNVMQKHNGMLGVESQEAKGTKVRLVFPRH
jgi:two-component system sporulation sensor kinase B